MSDSYAPSRETTEGRVYNLSGGDWERVLADPIGEQRIVLNMGPQHPSTHGVLRLIVELEGETVTDMRTVIGYLHTGIEKNTEYRTWTQAVTFLTRADYLAPLFNETAYCLAVEKLLGVTVPTRAQLIRLLVMELNRVSSHWVALATGGMEMGALTAMTNGLRARERCLDMLEMITGLRMNHAYVRPGGIAQDLPDDACRACATGSSRDPQGDQRPATSCVHGPADLGQPAAATSAGSASRAACRSASRGRCCARPGCRGTCARPSRTSATRRSTSTSRPRTAATAARASWSASTRCTSRLQHRRAGARAARAGTDDGSTTRRSRGRRSSRSARTAWATRSSTCRRS